MAPIITKMEEALYAKWAMCYLELPSYVHDLQFVISIWDRITVKGINVEPILDMTYKIVKRIVA